MTLLEQSHSTVGEPDGTSVVPADFEAGYSGHPGAVYSFPPTAASGKLGLKAQDNADDYEIDIENDSFGQATVIKIADPADANARMLIAAGAAPFVSGNIPVADGVEGLMVDSGVALLSLQPFTATVTLNAAAVNGAYAAPALILPAPGAGKTVILLNSQMYTEVAAAFADGGVAQLQYDNTVHAGGALALSATTPAAEVTAAASQIYSQLGKGSIATTVTTGVTDKGIYFSNATGAFTGGVGSSITFTVQYLVLTASV